MQIDNKNILNRLFLNITLILILVHLCKVNIVSDFINRQNVNWISK